LPPAKSKTIELKLLRKKLMDTAVLLLIWNRPAFCRRIMDAIRVAKPQRLYVAADGPRDEECERALCDQARKTATFVDWKCDVRTLFRDKNLGCGLAVSSGIDWFFKNEDEGIILEDDCVPTPTFFPYCTELLARFRCDKRIMCISGNSFQNKSVTRDSYYFSRYMHCWGWATWRRAWALYDFEMLQWPECRHSNLLQLWGGKDQEFTHYWLNIFDQVASGKIDTWDYQWQLSCWINNGLTCLPRVNLVANVGFGPTATHTTDASSQYANILAHPMDFPLIHPKMIRRNVKADTYTHHLQRNLSPLGGWRRIRQLVRRVARGEFSISDFGGMRVDNAPRN
jgi:GT2 family glycosyltransferase